MLRIATLTALLLLAPELRAGEPTLPKLDLTLTTTLVEPAAARHPGFGEMDEAIAASCRVPPADTGLPSRHGHDTSQHFRDLVALRTLPSWCWRLARFDP